MMGQHLESLLADASLTILLSKERLQSYSSIQEHFENLQLIANITPKLATIEIALRNLLDHELSKIDSNWIENSTNEQMQKELDKIKNKEKYAILTHHQYLSKLTLGIVIKTIRDTKLQNSIIDLKDMGFKKYDISNRDYFYLSNNKRSLFNNINKVDIVLSLLHNLRNRCYHWENIKKMRHKNNMTFPRLTTTMNNTFIGIHPNKIETFLEDLLRHFDDRLVEYCGN